MFEMKVEMKEAAKCKRKKWPHLKGEKKGGDYGIFDNPPILISSSSQKPFDFKPLFPTPEMTARRDQQTQIQKKQDDLDAEMASTIYRQMEERMKEWLEEKVENEVKNEVESEVEAKVESEKINLLEHDKNSLHTYTLDELRYLCGSNEIKGWDNSFPFFALVDHVLVEIEDRKNKAVEEKVEVVEAIEEKVEVVEEKVKAIEVVEVVEVVEEKVEAIEVVEVVEEKVTRAKLEIMTVKDLKQLCKDRGIKGYSKKEYSKKKDLIDFMMKQL